jgi:C-terminal processing protease CtpA/Prc
MLGDVFDHDVKLADRIGRKEMKAETAKSPGNSAFSGKLIVLVDSGSASAAELFHVWFSLNIVASLLGTALRVQ